VNRADFALLLQKHFSLPQPKHPVSFSDVRPPDLIYPAVQALAPVMHREALCPGCQLSANFSANKPTSRAESAIILVSILVAGNKLHLLSPASANAVLAGAPDVGGLPLAARPYIATAIQNGILTLLPGNTIQPAAPYTHPGLMAALETINTTFGAFPVPVQEGLLPSKGVPNYGLPRHYHREETSPESLAISRAAAGWSSVLAPHARAQNDVQDHGGPAMQSPTVYLIFWLPSGFHFDPSGATGDTTFENLMVRFLATFQAPAT
jgi:hypothetical protein